MQNHLNYNVSTFCYCFPEKLTHAVMVLMECSPRLIWRLTQAYSIVKYQWLLLLLCKIYDWGIPGSCFPADRTRTRDAHCLKWESFVRVLNIVPDSVKLDQKNISKENVDSVWERILTFHPLSGFRVCWNHMDINWSWRPPPSAIPVL